MGKREYMLSSEEPFETSFSGEPIVSPTLDMVLGCYYLTHIEPGGKGKGKDLSQVSTKR